MSFNLSGVLTMTTRKVMWNFSVIIDVSFNHILVEVESVIAVKILRMPTVCKGKIEDTAQSM